MKSDTCCFAGHRKIPIKEIHHILMRLNEEVDQLINRGVTNFISGGAMGFDMIAASIIVAKKEMGAKVKLIFALPCRNQDKLWPQEQKHLYSSLLSEADEVRYISEEHNAGSMKKRNYYMVDNSKYCICALNRSMSGTAQTVNYAIDKGLNVINIAE